MALPAAKRATSASQADRRLAVGLVVSLLLHGALLLLQFGVPNLGMSGAAPPLTVRIAAAPVPAEALAPLPVADITPLPPQPPAPVSGMRLVNPVVEATPAPAPPPKARPTVKKDKARKARRISPPIPAPSTVIEPARVITQDATANEFVVPLARPEEAEQKTVDIKQSQHGEDDGDAETSAAAEAAAAKAGLAKAAEEAEARRLADEERLAAIEAAQRAAEQDKLQRRLALAEQAKAEDERRKTEQLAQQQKVAQQAAQLKVEQDRAEQQRRAEQARIEQQKLEQQQIEQNTLQQQKAEQQKLEQQKLEQQKLEQQKLEQQKIEQQKLEQQKLEQQKLEQQRAEREKVEKQRLEQQRNEQQKAEQQKAEQQKAEQQRAEQQRAEQQKADRDRADQAARQAAQQAGQQRGTAPAGTPSSGIGNEGRGPGAGGTGGAQIPRNMLGSDAANRARDLIKGIDVLRGDPPRTPPRMRDDRRVAVGASERDLSLRMYVESWRQKIERNGGINYPRSWADEVRIDPLVSVAVRSDGSVEDVTIITSSGRADMDEAVRRIVRVNARYSPFPPTIAQRYDVIEIRRIWRFDDNLKLLEEVR